MHKGNTPDSQFSGAFPAGGWLTSSSLLLQYVFDCGNRNVLRKWVECSVLVLHIHLCWVNCIGSWKPLNNYVCIGLLCPITLYILTFHCNFKKKIVSFLQSHMHCVSCSCSKLIRVLIEQVVVGASATTFVSWMSKNLTKLALTDIAAANISCGLRVVQHGYRL